jgi:aryl carrier-like protein
MTSLKEKIEEIIDLKIEDIDDDMKLTESGISSIEIVQLAHIIYEHTNIEITFKDVFKIDKKWIVDLIEKYDK